MYSQIQCDLYQITNEIFHRTRKKTKIHMETPKTPKSQSSLKKEMEMEESAFLTSDCTTKLQSRHYGTGTQKQKYRPVEQDRKPPNKSIHLWVPYI